MGRSPAGGSVGARARSTVAVVVRGGRRTSTQVEGARDGDARRADKGGGREVDGLAGDCRHSAWTGWRRRGATREGRGWPPLSSSLLASPLSARLARDWLLVAFLSLPRSLEQGSVRLEPLYRWKNALSIAATARKKKPLVAEGEPAPSASRPRPQLLGERSCVRDVAERVPCVRRRRESQQVARERARCAVRCDGSARLDSRRTRGKR